MSTGTKTPETLTATGRAAQLGVVPTAQKTAESRPAVSEQQKSLARRALEVERPPSATNGLRVGDEYDGAQTTLPSKSIRPYEHNPRSGLNPKYPSIKDSIRVQGVTNHLTVTKRPGDSHYIPFSGGNTRLQCVHELLDETQDARWQTMTVTFRAWCGEAAVIAAHLAENEQRGDTSYWEKAQGLWSLKTELEKETGKTLTASDLAKEVKRLGMDFGLSVVKALLFVVEYLRPVGPWVRAKMVEESVRPAIVGLGNLCEHLLGDHLKYRAALNRCLEVTGDILRIQAQESSEVTLDAGGLVRSLNEAVAGLLLVPAAQVPLMVAARAANPRMTADELRKVGSSLPAMGAAAKRSQPGDTAAAGEVAVQRASESEAPAATQAAPTVTDLPAPTQLPLSPAMLAPVHAPAGSTALVVPPVGNPGTLADPTDPIHAPGTVDDILRDITRLAELGDVVCVCDAMPLGYFVELPDAGIDALDGEPPANARLRKAAWHVLAALSGQFDRRLLARLPDASNWKTLVSKNQLSAPYERLVMGVARDGECHLSVVDVHEFFWHPQLGHLFLQLWSWALHWREAEPQRFVDQLQPISA